MSDISTIRAARRTEFGARKYRITKAGDIHVNGMMPNTNQTGWYLFGHIGNAQTLRTLGL